QPGQTTTIRTAYGEQRQVLLPDSSRVWMNALSTLSYPADFGNHRRDVEISGEVYFEVRRDPVKPFLVKTGELSVQVLGTQFLLNAYEEEPEIRVSLLTGRVAVQQWDKTGILKPGEQLVLNRKRMSPSD